MIQSEQAHDVGSEFKLKNELNRLRFQNKAKREKLNRLQDCDLNVS
jgi:hypothetical protein